MGQIIAALPGAYAAQQLRRYAHQTARQEGYAGNDGEPQAQMPVLSKLAKDGLGAEKFLQQCKCKRTY